jgi:membrane associated rhomboid family serine protease
MNVYRLRDRPLLLMSMVFASIVVGLTLGATVFFAKPLTQQHLQAIPLWYGAVAGAVGGVVIGMPIALIYRRRKRTPR